MRTIKFRGKRVDNGEWVFGYYVSTHELHHTQQHTIFTDEYSPYSYLSRENFSVIPETVGQFTGLQDKNGKEIYEGDIDNNGNLIHYENGSWWSGGILLDWNIQFSNEFEIISNIHEGGNNVL